MGLKDFAKEIENISEIQGDFDIVSEVVNDIAETVDKIEKEVESHKKDVDTKVEGFEKTLSKFEKKVDKFNKENEVNNLKNNVFSEIVEEVVGEQETAKKNVTKVSEGLNALKEKVKQIKNYNDSDIKKEINKKADKEHTHDINDIEGLYEEIEKVKEEFKDEIKKKGSKDRNWFGGVVNNGPGGGVTDHGALTGLGDDDHTQYHNDARGDERYYTKTQLDGGQLDSRYYTETETNTLLNGKVSTTGNENVAGVKSYTTGFDLNTGGSTAYYNTADKTTNYERVRFVWSGNIFNIRQGTGGTGIARTIRIGGNSNGADTLGSNGNYLDIGGSNFSSVVRASPSSTVGWNHTTSGSMGLSSGTYNHFIVQPTLAQTGTAGYNALLINVLGTATGSGLKYLIRGQVSGADRFTVDETGLGTFTKLNLGVSTGVGRINLPDGGTTSAEGIHFGTDVQLYRSDVNTLRLDDRFDIVSPALTGSQATSALNVTQTWNTAGNPTAILLNVTNTASGAGSNLIDLQLNGASRFRVRRDGVTFIGSGTSIADGNLPLQMTTQGVGTEANIGINKNNAYGFLLGYKNGSGTNFSNYIGGYMRQVTTDPFGIVMNNTRLSTQWNADGSVALGGEITNTSTLVGATTIIRNNQVSITPIALTGSGNTSALSISQTWNTTGNPTAIILNITNTASGATSQLIDLQVGGASQFRVTRGGDVNISNAAGGNLIIGGRPAQLASIQLFNPATGGMVLSPWSSSQGVVINGLLTVNGNITQTGSYSVASGQIYGGITGTYFTPYDGATGNTIIRSSTTNSISRIRFQTGGTSLDRMYINNDGTVAIGTSTVNPRSLLTLASTTQGFTPPKMTTAQRNAIATVAGDAGLTIFNTTTAKLECWDGTAWQTAW